MVARTVLAKPKPGSRIWRRQAVCTDCGYAGYRYESEESAEGQAHKHNDEHHPPETRVIGIDPGCHQPNVMILDTHRDGATTMRSL